MATGVLILGESGTGKSTSLRNFKADEIAYINVSSKPLPFRGKFEMSISSSDCTKVISSLKSCPAKVIVIDDAQYLMGFEEMARRNEKGWDKFSDIGGKFFDLVKVVNDLPADVTVYFLMHVETTSDGLVKAKTSGQMLDKKITLEGMFSIVLRTCVQEGQYFFRTHNSGFDTVKTPLGMFEAELIPNDLKAVDSTIRSYYEV